jgi:hypothetical protein
VQIDGVLGSAFRTTDYNFRIHGLPSFILKDITSLTVSASLSRPFPPLASISGIWPSPLRSFFPRFQKLCSGGIAPPAVGKKTTSITPNQRTIIPTLTFPLFFMVALSFKKLRPGIKALEYRAVSLYLHVNLHLPKEQVNSP